MLTANGLLVHINKPNESKVVSKTQMTLTNNIDGVDCKTSCRICLKREDPENLYCLFGSYSTFNNVSLASALMECFCIKLKQDAMLPNCVCTECASTAMQCYIFKKRLESSNNYFEEWWIHEANKNIKEELLDDTQNEENAKSGVVAARNVEPTHHKEFTDEHLVQQESVAAASNCQNLTNNVSKNKLQLGSLFEDYDYYKDLNDDEDDKNDIVIEEHKELDELELKMINVVGYKNLEKENIKEELLDDTQNEENAKSDVVAAPNEEHFLCKHTYHKEFTDEHLVQQENVAAASNCQNLKNNVSKNKLQLGSLFEDYDYYKDLSDDENDENDIVIEEQKELDELELKTISVVRCKNLGKVNLQLETAKNETKNDPRKSEETWWSKRLGPPYECKICGQSYDGRYNKFYIHVRKHYIHKTPCVVCGKMFSKELMVVHMRSHTKEKPCVCQYCSARFTVEDNLKRHLMSHASEKSYMCDKCGKFFNQSSEDHIYLCYNEKRVKRSNVNLDGEHKEYKCPTCGKVYQNEIGLKLHQNVHVFTSCSKTYTCKTCFKKFTSSLNFKIHTFGHELRTDDVTDQQKTEWRCKICSKVFVAKPSLRRHLRIHLQKQLLCIICGREFATEQTLKIHNRQHTGEKPYSCDICNKAFIAYINLNLHLRIHSGEKPYKCKVCLRSFAQQQQLVNHMYTHTGEKKYKCPYCDKSFALNGNLTVHKRRHTGELPYICNLCNQGFCNSSALRKHKVVTHNDAISDKTKIRTVIFN